MATETVLSILSLTTRPTIVRCTVVFLHSFFFTCCTLQLVKNGLHTGNISSHAAMLVIVCQLAGRLLHAQIELFPTQS